MRLSVYTFLLCIYCACTGFGQGYQRLFEVNEAQPDTMLVHAASTTTSDGGTISLLLRSNATSIVITVQDKKGKYTQNHEIKFNENFVGFSEISDISYNGKSGLIQFTLSNFDERFIGSMKLDGTELLIKRIDGLYPRSFNLFFPQSENFNQNKEIYGVSDTSLVLSMIENFEAFTWSSKYSFQDTFGKKYDFENAPDLKINNNEIYSLGQIDKSQYLLKTDSLGNVMYTRSYSIPNSVLNAQSLAISKNRVATSGQATIGENTQQVIILTDSVGQPLWSKTLAIENTATFINDIVFSQSGDIVLTGSYRPSEDTISSLFAAAVNPSGELKWATDFNKTPYKIDFAAINATENGMMISYNTALDGKDALGLINVTDEGKTMCNDTISAQLSDITIVVDTLIITRTEGIIFGDTVLFELKKYDKVIEPRLITNPKPKLFCPNEPIMQSIKASVSSVSKNNVTYEWSTGETTDSITVTDEGMYTVTATVTENTCYKLCDTVNISRSQLPMASISENNSSYCESKTALLTAQVADGRAPFNYVWSDGEGQSIVVSDEKKYTLTVVDDCGDKATASYNFIAPLNQITTNSTTNKICAELSLELIPNAQSTLGDIVSFDWSNGETSPTIKVTTDGTYTVKITDTCGEEYIETFDVKVPSSEECSCIKFPSVFFPQAKIPGPMDSMDISHNELDVAFGGVSTCEVKLKDIVSEYEFKVFNRWGEEIFSTNDPAEKWDGKKNDSFVAPDVYVWYAQYIEDGETTTKKGSVTVVY